MERAYIVSADYGHRDRFSGDADLKLISNFDIMTYIRGETPVLPVFEFLAQHPPLPDSGLLSVEGNFSNLMVASKKMLDIIDSESKFLPRFTAAIKNVPIEEYYVVYPPILQIFDWENSEYDKQDVVNLGDNIRLLGNVKKYCFTKSEEELPPFFKLDVSPSVLFIKGSLRGLLSENNIRGISYMLPASYSKTNQLVTDLPV